MAWWRFRFSLLAGFSRVWGQAIMQSYQPPHAQSLFFFAPQSILCKLTAIRLNR